MGGGGGDRSLDWRGGQPCPRECRLNSVPSSLRGWGGHPKIPGSRIPGEGGGSAFVIQLCEGYIVNMENYCRGGVHDLAERIRVRVRVRVRVRYETLKLTCTQTTTTTTTTRSQTPYADELEGEHTTGDANGMAVVCRPKGDSREGGRGGGPRPSQRGRRMAGTRGRCRNIDEYSHAIRSYIRVY